MTIVATWAVAGFVWRFSFFHAEPYSWRQLEALAFVIIGACLFAYGVKKLAIESSEAKREARSIKSIEQRPDYTKYTDDELRQILTRIDVERFPDRVEEIKTRLTSLDSTRR